MPKSDKPFGDVMQTYLGTAYDWEKTTRDQPDSYALAHAIFRRTQNIAARCQLSTRAPLCHLINTGIFQRNAA